MSSGNVSFDMYKMPLDHLFETYYIPTQLWIPFQKNICLFAYLLLFVSVLLKQTIIQNLSSFLFIYLLLVTSISQWNPIFIHEIKDNAHYTPK